MSLPGVDVDEGVLGRRGYELLSAESLRHELAPLAATLDLDPCGPDLIRQFDRCFENPRTQACATELAQSYGRKLGYLLLMLRHADAENRAARPEWSDEHWAFWQSMRYIRLGGGMVAGKLGRHALQAAQGLLLEEGVRDLTLELSPYAAYLPLVGLARAAPAGTTRMLLLDFGQTSIKRGLSSYQDRCLKELHVLPAAPTVCTDIHQLEYAVKEVRRRWHHMLDVIAQSWSQVPPFQRDGAALGVSLACYLHRGHPSAQDGGCYSSLQALCDHLETFMGEEIASRLEVTPPLILMHDGSAAATAYAGSKHTVVITLGTAIGSGFPPSNGHYRPRHSHFGLGEDKGIG